MKILQSSLFRAICAIAIGILLIKYPDNTVTWMTVAIGVLFLLSGIISVIVYVNARKHVAEYKITDAEALMITWEEVWIVERDQILHCYTLDSIPVFGERCWQAFSKPGLETFLTGFSECVRYTLRSSATIGYTCRSVNRQQDISGS